MGSSGVRVGCMGSGGGVGCSLTVLLIDIPCWIAIKIDGAISRSVARTLTVSFSFLLGRVSLQGI